MSKSSSFGRGHLVFAAEIIFFLVLFGILLMISFSPYLKLAAAFLFILFLSGWFFLRLSRLQQRYQLLTEGRKEDCRKLGRLCELAGELSKTPPDRDKLSELEPKLTHLCREYFTSNAFSFFVKRKNAYQVLISHNTTPPQKKKISIKSGSEFVSLLKSAGSVRDLNLVEPSKIPACLRTLQKEQGLNRVVPLSTESDLWGFVILKSDRDTSQAEINVVDRPWEEQLSLLAFGQMAAGLEKHDLAGKLAELERKSSTNGKQIRTEVSSLNRDLKRKIFDLNTVLELAGNLYSVQDEEGLFSELAQMMQDHLGAKSVFLMLPDKENGNITGRYFYGAQVSELFGEGTISELKIEKGKALYNWIKNEKPIWLLYGMQKLSREEKLLGALLSSGFQVGAKLPFSGGTFGTMFLGEKADGAKYRQTDLDILSILVNMAGIAYKNVRHLKSIEELSYTDSITSLYNYRYFYKRLTEEVFRAKRFDRKLALVIFDIDDFKVYNDTYGHQAGDQLLKQLGELLSRTVRSIDVVSRYGGEEFCVIMPESDQEECLKFLERLRKNIMNYPFKDEHSKEEHNVTVSLGGAIYPYDARSVDRLIYCADMALLKAKNTGKNRSVMYQEKLAPVAQ